MESFCKICQRFFAKNLTKKEPYVHGLSIPKLQFVRGKSCKTPFSWSKSPPHPILRKMHDSKHGLLHFITLSHFLPICYGIFPCSLCLKRQLKGANWKHKSNWGQRHRRYFPLLLKCKSSFNWARICKRLRSPGIDFKESVPPAYVAWRASTSNRAVVPNRQSGNRFLCSFKSLQILTLVWMESTKLTDLLRVEVAQLLIGLTKNLLDKIRFDWPPVFNRIARQMCHCILFWRQTVIMQ